MMKKAISTIAAVMLMVSITACGNQTQSETKGPSDFEGNVIVELQGENSYYAVVNDTLDWDVAKLAAEAAGGHLATITSSDEQNEIVTLLASAGEDEIRNSYFLGGIDQEKNGEYAWVTGEPFTYMYWKKNEPKPDKGEQYLAIFAKTYVGNSGTTEPGRWNDAMIDGTAYDGAGDAGFFTPDQMGYIIEWDNY
jgi:hypothetical protein